MAVPNLVLGSNLGDEFDIGTIAAGEVRLRIGSGLSRAVDGTISAAGDSRPFKSPVGTFTELAAEGRTAWGDAAATATIAATGRGASAFGFAGGTSTITASGQGALAVGRVNGGSTVLVSGHASLALGYGYGAGGNVKSNNPASMAMGYVYGASTILTGNSGSLVMGVAGGGGYLFSSGAGSIVNGTVQGGGGATCQIFGNGGGSHTFGYVNATGAGGYGRIHGYSNGGLAGGTIQVGAGQVGRIRTYGGAYSAHAFGHVVGVGLIEATMHAAVAAGQTSTGGQIQATGIASHAFGRAVTNDILASGSGSIAWGDTTAGPITASATNSFQFGVGVNALADTLQVGTGIKLKGTVGAPAVPTNGDCWVDAAGQVFFHSVGVDVGI